MDGIYRVSGNLATIQKLRFLVDEGWWRRPADVLLMSPEPADGAPPLVCLLFSEEHVDLDHSQWEDVHVVTGALKMFFRELPEPLVPFRFFPLFVEAISELEQNHPAAPGAPPSRRTCL